METTTASKKDQLLEQLNAHSSALSGAFPSLTEAARESLTELDFPTTRQENWKYTRTTKLSAENWTILPSEAIIQGDAWRIPELDAHELVWVNGFFRADLSSSEIPAGLTIGKPSSQTPRHEEEITMDFFSALHEAHCTDALVIRAEKGKKIAKPFHVLFIQHGSAPLAQPHLFLETAELAELEVIVSFVSSDGEKAFCNAVIEGNAGASSKLTCTLIEREGAQNALICRSLFSLDRDAVFHIHTHTISGNWVRNDLHIRLNGTGINAFLNGIYLPRESQHIDNHTLVDHRHPHCESNELYKGVLSDRGKAVFNGKVYVQLDAQKTNAYQNNANIMLSNDASVYTKPELEIYADDVKCSHGSTTGQLDEQAIFYLRARGLGEDNARRLLTTAFIHEVLDRVESEPLRNYVVELLKKEDLLLD
jgi:Fe-S cluster assembly protein SufD